MTDIYLLHHVHSLDDAKECVKLMGVFSSLDKAEAAKTQALTMPGFVDSPDGFSINRYVLDDVAWTKGFAPA